MSRSFLTRIVARSTYFTGGSRSLSGTPTSARAGVLQPLPSHMQPYKRLPPTGTFVKDTIPAGLRRRHNLREGTWGQLNVVRGRLLFRTLEPTAEEFELSPGQPGTIEPQVYHEVEPLTDDIEFFVVFHKLPEPNAAD
eukprot:TRINITY_DN3195_c0_g2_i1.p1 TRINITY_DN3195_c0_g2~~TRINITY_DN3195_c0_g2_i1.p1  ORF type:complete len:138 (+),score=54.43 TRINITY_DN3195_c0_g2_i1:201-614(+)